MKNPRQKSVKKNKEIKLSPLLISRKEAQQLLGISSRTSFDRRIAEGAITPVYIGKGHARFQYSAIKKLAGEKP